MEYVISWYVKADNKYVKYFDKNEESSYFEYWDVNNSYGLEIPQKLPVNDFKQVADISEFDEDFIKSCNEKSDEGYFRYPSSL